MRIVLAPLGAHGDFYCMLALAKALQQRGHWITFCAPEEYRSQVYQNEFRMVSSGVSYRKILSGETEGDSQKLLQLLSEDVATHFVSLRDALREADVLLGGTLQLAGPSLAEQVGVRYLTVAFSPVVLDANEFPAFAVPFEKNTGFMASMRRSKRKKEWDESLLNALNHERQMTGLKRVEDLFGYMLQSGHRLIAVDPNFHQEKDTPAQTVTGFWRFEDTPSLDPELDAFLAAGEPPLYLAWFRQDHEDAAGFFKQLAEPLIAAGKRLLISHEWKEYAPDLRENCRIVDSRDYGSWFPRLGGVVHCGHHRIISHAVYAGIPQAVVPYTVEQYDWAQKLAAANVGVICQSNPAVIFKAAQQISGEQSYRENAETLAQNARQTNGVSVAVDAIEKITALS